MHRLDATLGRAGAFAVLWGRRRVGKSRLLTEWCRRRQGLYTVADQSAPSVQRRYLAAAVNERFPGFADVEYPDWRSLLMRLADEADPRELAGAVRGGRAALPDGRGPERARRAAELARPPRSPFVRRRQRFEPAHDARRDSRRRSPVVRPGGRSLRRAAPEAEDTCTRLFHSTGHEDLVSAYALWGGMPRYWELAEPFGTDLDTAVDSLVLDPSGPLHGEPDRLLLEEVPPATALRPLLDTIGAGAHRISEIAGRLGRPASSLSKPLAALVEMGFVRRETPFGADPKSGKRSLYRIDDPFMRLWFRVVAPHRAALASAPRETRLQYWYRHRPSLEAHAWEELCRMAVPLLHRADTPLADLGPFEPAQRYWRGNAPERDVVARSIDGRRLLVGEAKWTATTGPVSRIGRPRPAADLPGATSSRDRARAVRPRRPGGRDRRRSGDGRCGNGDGGAALIGCVKRGSMRARRLPGDTAGCTAGSRRPASSTGAPTATVCRAHGNCVRPSSGACGGEPPVPRDPDWHNRHRDVRGASRPQSARAPLRETNASSPNGMNPR